MMKNPNRCAYVNMGNPLYIRYHDEEWGVPEHSDQKLFEMLLLECFQAGLSWECVLNKREAFRTAFDHFDADKIACYGEEKIQQLMNNPAIIRNRLKIRQALQMLLFSKRSKRNTALSTHTSGAIQMGKPSLRNTQSELLPLCLTGYRKISKSEA